MAKYTVETWDGDKQKFTPQDGVLSQVEGVGELRRTLRQLRDMGYRADKSDSLVAVVAEPVAMED